MTPPATPALHADGANLRDDTGKLVKYVGVDFYSLGTRWFMANGRDALVGPKLDEIRQVAHEGGYDGPIMLRAFRHAAPPNPFALSPFDHADYYPQMAACTDFCGTKGFYVDWTGGDAQIIFPSADPDKAERNGPRGFTQHVNDFTAKVCLGRPNAIWQTENEDFKNGHVADVPVPQWDATRPILRGSGAYGDYNPNDPAPLTPFQLVLDVQNFHHPRDSGPWAWPQWLYNLPTSAAVLERAIARPLLFDEEMGVDEMDVPGSRFANPYEAYLFGLMLAWVAGVTLHSTDGLFGNGYRPITRACHVAYFTACAAVIASTPQTGLVGA